jgi:hypothetical protein
MELIEDKVRKLSEECFSLDAVLKSAFGDCLIAHRYDVSVPCVAYDGQRCVKEQYK